jgi:hypothetical protein
MPDETESLVTPEGVRDGDPAALSGLTDRRGSAVLAYAEHVAAPGRAIAAAAEAFGRFRGAVVLADDPHTVDPERTLLRGTRYATALAAPVEVPMRMRMRGGQAPCGLVPELLAARAERELSEADRGRLARHLGRCASCRAAEERFRAGEHAYRDAPIESPPADAAREIMRALLAAAPRVRAVDEEGHGRVDVQAMDAVPLGAIEAQRTQAVPEPQGHVPEQALAAVAAPGEARVQAVAEAEAVALAAPADAAEAYAAEPAPDEAPPGADPNATMPFTPVFLADDFEERQPTYEFDALPAEAFDLAPLPAPAPSGGGVLRIVLPLLILLAFVVAAVAVALVLRG